MSYRLICALFALVSVTQTVYAATQSETTPYDDLQTQLVLKPGQTYLSFMQKKVKPALDSFQNTIVKDPANKARNYRQLQKNLIAEGAGVAVRIDDNNYIFNVGYLDGSDPQNDVKSGRSYGVGPTGRQSDPSDLAYLRELEQYLQSEPGAAGEFMGTLMSVLVNCDAAGWSQLSEAGQIVATDFLAIYTAESDRHLMVDLNPKKHPWEIDLAAATFVSVFDASTGLIMQDGSLVKGGIEGWWKQGQSGSGIGNTRRDRLALQKLIAEHEADSSETKQLAAVVGEGETIQTVLEYLNSDQAPAKMSEEEASSLVALMKGYLGNVQQHANAIAQAQ